MNMKGILHNLEGDKTIWAVVALLALFSFLPVYSASSNLVYVVGNGTTMGHLLKHALLLSSYYWCIPWLREPPSKVPMQVAGSVCPLWGLHFRPRIWRRWC